CEQLCSEFAAIYGLKAASLRVFSAYGPGLRRQVIWDICSKLLHDPEPIFQGTGKESRDFVHAADVARAVWQVAITALLEGESYNVATGCETTIAELTDQIGRLLSLRRPIRFDGRIPPGMPSRWRADISKLGGLGFQPAISLKQGLTEYVAWYRQE